MIEIHEAGAPCPDARLETGSDFRRPRDEPDAMKVGSLAGREWIERRAKLFETGNFPDKGVRVSMEDLAALAASFKGPVPVLIEHSDSALQMGFLTRVEALGDELFGTVALTKEANELLEASGAKSLSLGLSTDLSEIREVSIVRNPRVADAELYSGFCFCGEFDDARDTRCVMGDPDFAQRHEGEHGATKGASEDSEFGGVTKSGQPGTPIPRPLPPIPTASKQGEGESPLADEPLTDSPSQPFSVSSADTRFQNLKDEVRRGEAQRTVEGFVRAGRICPAQVPFAEAMLQAEDVIQFDGESRPIRQLLIAMIERQPPMQLFSAAVPENVSVDSGAAKLLPEEAEFYRKHFPDVSLEEIAARKR